MKTFTLIGAAGYVAPRHIRAIKALDYQLLYAFDPMDCKDQVTIEFPDANIFTDFSSFEKQFKKDPSDFVVICSPNHLHAEQIKWALRNGADVICEKPLVLDPMELDALLDVEHQSGKKVYAVLQMRLMDEIIDLKKKIESSPERQHEVVITHITPRNEAYFNSWKGKEAFSGGILTNIGIHLFDLLIWIFGPVIHVNVEYSDPKKNKGELLLSMAKVSWFLSVDKDDLPLNEKGYFRKLTIDGKEISLESGLETLHDRVYHQILDKKAPGIKETYSSIEFCKKLINKDL